MPTPPSSNGSPEAPPTGGRLLLRLVLGLIALGVIGAGVSLLSANLSSGIWRIIVAVLIALVVGRFGFGYLRQITNPPPPEEIPESVPETISLSYVCEMCGLELEVVKVAKDKAPKHCGESMKLVVNRGV